MNNQKKLDELHARHSELVEKRRDLEHKKDRSERPPDGTSITIGASTFVSKARLELIPQEKLELEAEILYTRINLLKLAEEIHQIRFDGNVPEWIPEGIRLLRRQVQRLFVVQ